MTDLIPLVLDFESFYDKDYSLKKMPTCQYVRDPRFSVLGAGVRVGAGEPTWLEPEPLSDFLSEIPWGQVLLICHNAQFDGLVLTEYYGYKPRQYACTMFMMRWLISQGLLDPRMRTNLDEAAKLVGMEKGNLEQALANDTLGEYATDDAAICGALYDKFWNLLPGDEQGYIDIHVRMAVEPVFDLDTETLRRLADADKALEELFPLVRKDDKFAAALTALGVNPEYKTTTKGNLKLALAKTDKFMQSLENHPNELVRMLADLRLKSRSTIMRSRAQRFLDVGAPLPAPILYYGAHTGRGSGLDKINVQNLPRKGGLRECIKAPPGHKLVIVDSSQIEVRTEAWLAGQEDLLEDFRQGRDPYLSFAAYRYREDYDGLVARRKAGDAKAELMRTVSKAAVLALGFMQGAGGFEAYCETYGIPLGQGEAEQVVQAYRAKYTRHVALANQALLDIKNTGQQQAPNGTKLTYPELRITADGTPEWRRPVVFAKSVNEGWGNIWRGAAVENCLDHDTEVLTCQGWVPLSKVSRQHQVWDGVAWVSHGGFIDQGRQRVIDFGGVWLTPDHKVLTEAGFVPASETTYEEAYGYTERLHRGAARVDDGDPPSGFRRAADTLARALRLRSGQRDARGEVLQGRGQDMWGLRLPVSFATPAGDQGLADARDVPTPSVLGMAVYAGPVPAPYASGMEELWRAGHSGLRALGGFLRGLLGGHGAYVSGGPYFGAHRQWARLLQRELPVGRPPNPKQEPTEQCRDRHPLRAYVGLRGGGAERAKSHDPVVPTFGWCPRGQHVQPAVFRPVGDLLNAGPRHRFTVRGTDGRPFIVSNCVQKVARDVVFWQGLQMHREGLRIVLLVHDEVVLLARDEDAETTLATALCWMQTSPPWAEGLPLGAEGRISDCYTK